MCRNCPHFRPKCKNCLNKTPVLCFVQYLQPYRTVQSLVKFWGNGCPSVGATLRGRPRQTMFRIIVRFVTLSMAEEIETSVRQMLLVISNPPKEFIRCFELCPSPAPSADFKTPDGGFQPPASLRRDLCLRASVLRFSLFLCAFAPLRLCVMFLPSPSVPTALDTTPPFRAGHRGSWFWHGSQTRVRRGSRPHSGAAGRSACWCPNAVRR